MYGRACIHSGHSGPATWTDWECASGHSGGTVANGVEDGALPKVAVHAARHDGLANSIGRALNPSPKELLRHAQGHLEHTSAQLRARTDLWRQEHTKGWKDCYQGRGCGGG